MNNEEKILHLLTEMKAEMDKRFDKVDERFDKVDDRLDKVDERLDKVDDRLDKVDERLDKVDERLDKVDERLDKVDERFDKVDERFDKVDERLQELDARSLKSAVLLETDVSRDIHLLYEGYSEISKKLDTLATKEQVEELSDDVAVIKEVVSRHSVDIGKLKKAQ